MSRASKPLLTLLVCFAVPAATLCATPAETPSPDLPSALHFEGETLPFRHFDSPRAALLPEDNGSGVAVADYDNDGYDDIYVVNFAGPVLTPRDELVATRPPGRLFRNLGGGNFEDVTEATGLRHVGWGMGALWMDANDDGWLDLIITGLDEVRLFLNQEGREFREAGEEYGLGELPCLATGAAAADYDGDRDLDLYVPCYVNFPWDRARDRPLVGGRPSTMTTPANYPAQRNFLFRNDGSTFVDVTTRAGVADEMGRGLQALFADLDGDHRPDLYVGNDQSFDKLYHNLGDGTFADVSVAAGTRDPRAGMGIALGDFDGDGAQDLFLTHWVGEQNALYKNLSADDFLLFEDVTYPVDLAPIDPSWVSWGSALVDLELDGDLDLFLVNGSTIEDEWTLEVLSNPKMIPQPLRVYTQQDGHFSDSSDSAGEVFSQLLVGRGAGFGDFDRDGLLDAVVAVHGGSPLVVWNRSTRAGHWLAVDLEGSSPNRFAVGAQVTVTSEGGGLWTQQILVGESYLSDSSYRLHFGLGAAETVAVQVIWPSGAIQDFEEIPTDRTVGLREGTAEWKTVSREHQEPTARGAQPANEQSD